MRAWNSLDSSGTVLASRYFGRERSVRESPCYLTSAHCATTKHRMPTESFCGKTLNGASSIGVCTAAVPVPRMIGRSQIISRSRGVSSSYSCPVCCPDTGPWYTFNPIFVRMVVHTSESVTTRWEAINCYGNLITWSGAATLFSANSSIATAVAGEGSAEALGHAAGETVVSTEQYWVDWYFDDGMDCYPWGFYEQADEPVEVQRPKSVSQESSEKTTYSNQQLTNCYNENLASNWTGYKRCVKYQVRDENGKLIKKVLTVHEDVTVQEQCQGCSFEGVTGDGDTEPDGWFYDMLALGNTGNGPQPGHYFIARQIFSTTVNNQSVVLRVNCLHYTHTDVTVTDRTSEGTSVNCTQPPP
jgi:hypothetical protein